MEVNKRGYRKIYDENGRLTLKELIKSGEELIKSVPKAPELDFGDEEVE